MTGDDAELVAASLRGDQAAFGELVGRHKAWLYRFVRRHAPDAEEAYDLVQETFASAWNALSRYDPERPLDIWLRRIALNKCRDLARKQAVRRGVMALIGRGQQEPPEVADTALTAEGSAVKSESLRRLQAAIAALPAHLREPLTLTALDGLSQKEAADVLGVNIKAIENRVGRAKKKLAQALERDQIADLASD